MIYGANGYTGRLVAREACARDLKPILAGRDGEAISRMGNRLGCETRVFSLDRAEAVAEHLSGVRAVLHCAGPFSATSAPMLAGCARSGTHYLDITGEIDVFESCHARHDEWLEAGIAVIPGVGMDVVPTDCLAAMLHERMPGATCLTLALKMGKGEMSPGTAKTAAEGLGHGCKIRRDSRIETIPLASKTREISFGQAPGPAVVMPWGDVATAYFTTGIPNIEVYFGMPEARIRVLRRMRHVAWLGRAAWIQSMIKRLIERRVAGPSDEARAREHVLIWAEAIDDAGETITERLRVPEGYTFTVDSSLACVLRVMEADVQPGYATPAQAFGSTFVLDLQGVQLG